VTLHTRRWPVEQPRASVLLVHGLGEHSGRWEHVGGRFADHGLDTYAFDLRGHGLSTGNRLDVERWSDFLDDVESMIEWARFPGRPLVLYGHSLGGLLCTTYAQSERPQPDLLVLSAPALAASLPSLLQPVVKILARVAPKIRVRTPVKGEQLSRDPGIARAYFADPLVETKVTVRFGAISLAAMRAALEHLDDIGLPLLVIHGGADTLVPTASSAPLGELPLAEREVFANLRHELHNEPEKDRVLDYVTAWVGARLGSD